MRSIFARYRIPQTLGVVPLPALGDHKNPAAQGFLSLEHSPKTADFLRVYRESDGAEIALHGLTHRTNRFSIPWRREYFEFRRLSLQEQEEMISRGLEILGKTLGVRPSTFIPPWNRLDTNTLEACVKNGLQIVSAGAFTPVVDGLVSLGVNCSLATFPSLLQTAQAGGKDFALLCVLYHSHTTRSPAELRALENAVRLAAETPGCRAMTIRDAVSEYCGELGKMNEAARNVVPQDQVPGTARARGVVYRRTMGLLGLGRALDRAHGAARTHYERGQYEEAARLSSRIDRLSKRFLAAARFGVAVGGLASGVLVSLMTSQAGIPGHVYVRGGWCLLLAALGGMAWWLATSPDTKREMLLATALATAGALGGVLLVR